MRETLRNHSGDSKRWLTIHYLARVMQEKQRDLKMNYSKSMLQKLKIMSEHSVIRLYMSFQEWYHDYLSDPKINPNDMIDKRHLMMIGGRTRDDIINVVDGHTILPISNDLSRRLWHSDDQRIPKYMRMLNFIQWITVSIFREELEESIK